MCLAEAFTRRIHCCLLKTHKVRLVRSISEGCPEGCPEHNRSFPGSKSGPTPCPVTHFCKPAFESGY